MNKPTSTIVIEKLIDLELIFNLKADLSRYKKKKLQKAA
jgi:hypothetical protein